MAREDPPRVSISVQGYDPMRGEVADCEGGHVVVTLGGDDIAISGTPAGLRDLARWCLVISSAAAPSFVHVHLTRRTTPLRADSLPLTIARLDDEG
jgi:hypothetical protein